MKKSKVIGLASLALFSTIVLAACGGNKDNSSTDSGSKTANSGELAEKQELNLIESAEIPTMDSVLNTDAVGSIVMNNVFEGLYRKGLDGENVLGMAKEEPTVSEDGLTYTFKL